MPCYAGMRYAIAAFLADIAAAIYCRAITPLRVDAAADDDAFAAAAADSATIDFSCCRATLYALRAAMISPLHLIIAAAAMPPLIFTRFDAACLLRYAYAAAMMARCLLLLMRHS